MVTTDRSRCIFTNQTAKIVNHEISGFYDVLVEDLHYVISAPAYELYEKNRSFRENVGQKCVQETAKLCSEGISPIWVIQEEEPITWQLPTNVVVRTIEEFKDRVSDHRDKGDKLLLEIAKNIETSGSQFTYTNLSFSQKARIGVISFRDLVEWLAFLRSKNLIQLSNEQNVALTNAAKDPDHGHLYEPSLKGDKSFTLTVEGWDQVNRLGSKFRSRQVFIAMAFTDRAGADLPSTTRDAIRSAVADCNFDPALVDESHHNDGVMDKIITLINTSKFVIADLTFNKNGVYYEAGYAKAKGLEVIHTVHKDHLKECHFDVKHLNLIVWKDEKDLFNRLVARMKALYGPSANAP